MSLLKTSLQKRKPPQPRFRIRIDQEKLDFHKAADPVWLLDLIRYSIAGRFFLASILLLYIVNQKSWAAWTAAALVAPLLGLALAAGFRVWRQEGGLSSQRPATAALGAVIGIAPGIAVGMLAEIENTFALPGPPVFPFLAALLLGVAVRFFVSRR